MLQSRTRSVPCAASTTPPSAQTHPGGLGGLVATPISALLPCSSRHTSPNFDLPMCQSPCSSRHTCPYSDLPNDQPPCSLGTHLHTPTSQTISPPALEAHIFVLRPPKLSTPLLFQSHILILRPINAPIPLPPQNKSPIVLKYHRTIVPIPLLPCIKANFHDLLTYQSPYSPSYGGPYL
jgi:hypothetical protein